MSQPSEKYIVLVVLAPLLILSGCGGNNAADADLAACDKQFPTGALIDSDRNNVIDCMKTKGWETDFITGSKWWQVNKNARRSSTYSK